MRSWGLEGGGSAGEAFFRSVDGFMENEVAKLVQQRDAVAPETEMVLNEFIPFLSGLYHMHAMHCISHACHALISHACPGDGAQ